MGELRLIDSYMPYGGSSKKVFSDIYNLTHILLGNYFHFITDINECNTTNHGCHMNASCNNVGGGYFCKCNFGFSGNGMNCSGIYFYTFILVDSP